MRWSLSLFMLMALGIQNMDTLQSEVEVEISAGENKNFQQPKVIKRPVIREIVKEGTGEHIFKCTSEIYCHSDFLAAIQNANIFLDSKYFVDMEGRFSEVVILENFRKLGVNPSKLQLERFVKENFDKPRKALLLKIPEDWTDRPKFLNKIHNDHLKSFSLNVHKTWKTLQRVVRKRKDCPGCATSLIELPLPFILPGGRFRELYYWDSYWILEGLFVSGMCETAKNQLLNFKYLVDTFGFIPNGSRIYYLNRSHPPKFITMVARYINECLPENERYAFVKDFLPSMKREHRFWLDRRTVLLSDPKYPDRVFKLNRYNADTHHARAESYIQDTILAAEAHFDKEQSKILFKHLSTGAESGWDFSSRWMEKPPYELSSIETADIAPVDLNSLLYKNERTMAELCVHVNDEKGHMFYTKLAADRLEAINIFLWSEDNQCWFDYNLKKGASMAGDHPFYVSNFAPIWHEAYDPKEMPPDRIEKILLNQGKLLFEYPGGVPIGDVLSTQQWDFPNVWAPMQHLFIETYERLHRLKDNDLFWRMRAIELARKFVKTAFCGYHRYGQFFEKYHAQLIGQPGGGGEYVVQDGFGWTNGVLLWMIKKYGDEIAIDPSECPPIGRPTNLNSDSEVDVDNDILLHSMLVDADRKERQGKIALPILFLAVVLIVLLVAVVYRRIQLIRSRTFKYELPSEL